MKMHVHPVLKSMRYAIEGIMDSIKEEPNLRVHLVFALIALVFGFVFKISEVEWLFLVLTITIVLILELINTSIEEITDLASPGIHSKAKRAKDVAAGAVLVSACSAIVVGLIIFLPKVLPVFLHLLY